MQCGSESEWNIKSMHPPIHPSIYLSMHTAWMAGWLASVVLSHQLNRALFCINNNNNNENLKKLQSWRWMVKVIKRKLCTYYKMHNLYSSSTMCNVHREREREKNANWHRFHGRPPPHDDKFSLWKFHPNKYHFYCITFFSYFFLCCCFVLFWLFLLS